jgi:hypothetical protein
MLVGQKSSTARESAGFPHTYGPTSSLFADRKPGAFAGGLIFRRDL